jgi:hypothetical protein
VAERRLAWLEVTGGEIHIGAIHWFLLIHHPYGSRIENQRSHQFWRRAESNKWRTKFIFMRHH